MTLLVEDEHRQTLRNGLIKLCVELCPSDGQFAVVRTDPAPVFKVLVSDGLFRHPRITLELDRANNLKKNPVAERAVQEMLRQEPKGGPVSLTVLAIATA